MPGLVQDRLEVTRFIEHHYARQYGARMRVEYPDLISVRNKSGDLLAAAGFRFAASGSLFLERYTGQPIDRLLNMPRTEIVEIGNLASLGGTSVFLFAALASYLESLGVTQAVITGTRTLEHRLSRLGLAPRRLCPARIECVNGDDTDWGSYYTTRPYLLTGSIELACRQLRGLFGEHFFVSRPRLFPRLYFHNGVA